MMPTMGNPPKQQNRQIRSLTVRVAVPDLIQPTYSTRPVMVPYHNSAARPNGILKATYNEHPTE